MATSKKSSKVTKAEWKGYHKVNLTDAQTEQFEAEYEAHQVQVDDLGILINNGYKFSLSWDAYNQGISASLYAADKKMEWAGYTLTAWAGDPNTAINLLMFKHYVVCEEQWEIVKAEREGSSSRFG